MSYSPHMTDGRSIRHVPPPVRVLCSCGITFERASEAEAVRAQAEHAAEMRHEDDHELEVF